MDKKILHNLLEKLEGLNWFFFGGLAVEIYTNGKRKTNDIDIALFDKDLYKFANRIGGKLEKRNIEHGDFSINDFGFIKYFKGKEIEATKTIPKILFERKLRMNYLDNEIFIQPLENLIAHKALMHREKDMKDLKLILNENLDIDFDFLEKEAERFGNKELIFSNLRKVGFDV